MNKILTFIVNENKEFILLKTNPNDKQFKKSIWYTVTGEYENKDNTLENTVKREIFEETGISKINKTMYLNWILKYNSLGNNCTEYTYISFIKKQEITLNEENIDYKWCNLEEFINKIDWFYNKLELKQVLEKALDNKLYFEEEKIEKL